MDQGRRLPVDEVTRAAYVDSVRNDPCFICRIVDGTHEFPHREMWEFGGDDSPAYKAQLKFDRLRYRLLPYIYSLAGQVTHDNGTMMRA